MSSASSRSCTAPGRNGKQKQKRSNQKLLGIIPRSGNASIAAAYSLTQQSSTASVLSSSASSTRMTHRELVDKISGTAAFTALGYRINPGNNSMFPWLSVQARGWQKYKFNRLSFTYYTRTGTTTPGSVTLAVDYDSADRAPDDAHEMSSLAGAVEDSPWKTLTHVANPSRLKELYVSTVLPPNTDIKTYDTGVLYLATEGGTSVNWGRLWVEYDVTFYSPALNESMSSGELAFSTATAPSISASGFIGPTTSGIDSGENGMSMQNALGLTTSNQLLIDGFVTGKSYVLITRVSGSSVSALGIGTFTPSVTTIRATSNLLAGSTDAVAIYEFTYSASGNSTLTVAYTCTAASISYASIVVRQINPI